MSKQAPSDDTPATLGDSKQAQEELAQVLGKAIATETATVRSEVKEMEERIIQEFKVVAENIHQDVADANQDEITLIKDQVVDHEGRIVTVESKIGIH